MLRGILVKKNSQLEMERLLYCLNKAIDRLIKFLFFANGDY